MKTYVFVIPTLFRVGSVLRTEIPRSLALQPDTRIVVVSPFAHDESFKKEFPAYIHEPLVAVPQVRVGRLNHLREIALAIHTPYFFKSHLIEYSAVARRIITRLPPKERIAWYAGILMQPFRALSVVIFNVLEERLLQIEAYESICKKYKVDAIILGTFSEAQDIVWLALSRRRKIPAFVIDFPWSYLETRVYAVPRPAHIFVWNERMREELLNNFPVSQDNVHIGGCQRYDLYTKKFPAVGREEFFKSIGADPNKKLIAYYIGMDYWHPYQHDSAELILESIRTGKLPTDTQLLVRHGWRQNISKEFLALAEKYPNLILEKAEEKPHQLHASHLLHYCDVSLSIFSSLAIDAAVVDKPMIYMGFAGFKEAHPNDEAIAQIFEYEFVKEATVTGGIRVAYNAEELVSLLSTYFKDPTVDRAGREAFVKKFLDTVDGKAGERIAQIIANNSN